VLAGAVDRSLTEGAPVGELLPQVAREIGRRIGAEYAEEVGAEADEDRFARTGGVLGRYGYEPVVLDDELCLANCPFDRLAADHTQLVCGMNHDLIEGVLEGAEVAGLSARLAPHAGFCCVRVVAQDAAAHQA
jgi:predicted ArsR family transcriptional regulator